MDKFRNSKEALIEREMQRKIDWLLTEKNSGYVKEALAGLRRGTAKPMGETIEPLRYVFFGLPDTLLEDERALQAIYTALTLYAFYRQGNDNVSIVSKNESIGEALRDYMNKTGECAPEDEERMAKKLGAVLKAKSIYEASRYLKNLISLIKSSKEPISIDYPVLAVDLYRFQNIRNHDQVALKWATDFYKKQNNKEEEK